MTGIRLTGPWWPLVAFLGTVAVLWPWITAPLDFQASILSTDDTFYYYAFAQNLAAGLGPTVDGVAPTNGVQPLWAALLTVLAWLVPGQHAYVTVVLAVCLASLLATGVIWCRLAWRFGGTFCAWITAVLLARLLVSHQWALLTGMEISLNLLVVSALAVALIRLHDHGWSHPVRGPLGLGLLLALFLAGRIDHVLLLAGPVILELGLRMWGRSAMLPAIRWRDLPLIAAPSLLLLAPWLIWNRREFGHWLPVSGAIKLWLGERALAAQGIDTPGERLAHAWRTGWWFVARPFAWSLESALRQDRLAGIGVAGFVGGLAATVALVPRGRRRAAVAVLAVTLLAILPRGFVMGYRLEQGNLDYANWYLTLAWPVGFFLVVHAAWRLMRLVPSWRGLDRLVPGLLLFVLWITFFPVKFTTMTREVTDSDQAWRRPLAKVAALRWAEANLPADAVLGSLNSGIMHYYAHDRLVHNLDGRVDDGGLLRVLESGGSHLDYMWSRGVTHQIDAVHDDSHWRWILVDGEIVYERPFGPAGEGRMVVIALPPSVGP